MNKLQSAIEAIMKMDNDELNQIIEAVKMKRTYLARSTTRALTVGDEVSFRTRSGYEDGKVIKVNRKTVVVDCGLTRYKVPASMLTIKETA